MAFLAEMGGVDLLVEPYGFVELPLHPRALKVVEASKAETRTQEKAPFVSFSRVIHIICDER